MKLRSFILIFVLGVVGLAGMASGLCLTRNSTSTPMTYWYQCFRSNDYSKDLQRSPVDVFGHVVSNSKIRVLRNGSYVRLSINLEQLAVLHCGVEEIEENAFQGLTKLNSLILAGNKLQVIKSAWLKELPNLKEVSFRSNRIKHVDEDFFSILPPLDVLDISNNRLTCLPTALFGDFNASQFHFEHNPLTWMCQLSLMDWSKETEIDEDCLDLVNTDLHYDLAKICLEKLPRPQLNENFMKKCAEETSREFLPTSGNYTVRQVCEFLTDRPSPFLNCTK